MIKPTKTHLTFPRCDICYEPWPVCTCESEDEEVDLEPWESDICPYCDEPMIDDLEIGQGYHVTAPCWMIGTGQHQLYQEWLADQERGSYDNPDQRRD